MNLKILLALFSLSAIAAQFHPCTRFSEMLEPNSRGCSWYWRCRDNDTNLLLSRPIEENCPNFLHFNYENQNCRGFNEDCEFDEDNFNQTPTRCPSFQSSFIPHFWFCNQYTFCFQGRSTSTSCPQGEHYSYFQNGCTTPFLADCRNDHNYCRGMNQNRVTARRHPYSCTSYHVCNECNRRNTLIELHCVSETHEFDNVNQQCDDATRVRCRSTGGGVPPGGGGNSTAPPSNSTAPATSPHYGFPPKPHFIQCTLEDVRREFVAHPFSCFHYFNCASGRSTVYGCPYGSHFDLERNQCWRHEDSLNCTVPASTTTPMTPI